MPKPAIVRGSEHVSTVIYEGNGGGQRVGNFIPFTDNGTIAKSCIFNSADSPGLSHTLSGDGNKKKFTISFWVKRGKLTGGYEALVIGGGTGGGTASSGVFFNSSNQLYTYFYGAEAITTNRTFEDTSKFYHVVVRVDTSLSTADDRVRMYVDGDQMTSFATRNNPSQDANETLFNVSGKNIDIGRHSTNIANHYLDGYMAEVNLADGQSYGPETFGLTDTSTGRWIPKSLSGITYGTNGFRMQFANSAGQTIGDDTSGQGNDKSAVNVTTSDLTTDSPTQNHATLSPLSLYKSSNFTLSEGNLKATSTSTSGTHSGQGGMRIPSGGKYYWECEIDSGKDGMGIGIIPTDTPTTSANPSTATLYLSNGKMRTTGSDSLTYGSGVNNGDIMGFALDLSDKDNGKLYVSVNGTYENSGNPVTGANPAPSKALIGDFRVIYQDGSNGYAPVYIYNFGQKAFNTAAPEGYSALQQDNFPETTKGIVDFVWIKNRDAADDHAFYDSSRGPLKEWMNTESAEGTITDGLQKFLKGGFAVEDDVAINTSGESYVSWNWVGNTGTEVANTAGSGANVATTVQVNDTAGFSICRFTGTGSTLRFAHGQSAAPEWIFAKRLGGSNFATSVYHHKTNLTTGDHYYLHFNESDAKVDTSSSSSNWRTVTSGYVEIGDNGNTNANSVDTIAYCWRGIPGFSKFGLYFGNGGSNGPTVFTGFKPLLLIIKCASNAGTNWIMWDNKRSSINPCDNVLYPDLSQAEATSGNDMDFLSNGFKCRGTNSNYNGSDRSYIYMAFAEHPFLGDGTNPCTAR